LILRNPSIPCVSPGGGHRLLTMDIQKQLQLNFVADEVEALVAVVRPILTGLLWGLKGDVAAQEGGPEQVKLRMLSRLHRPGDGDVGICFEYAVHDAVRRSEPMVVERITDALALCKVGGDRLDSILFAAEKAGSEQFIDTAKSLVTPESRLMPGRKGRPVHLQKHIEGISQAFRRPKARLALPNSISGTWKTDLFLGTVDTEKWVATTVKSNPRLLEGARGLRVGVVPASASETDAPYKDDKRNLVICPLLHDGDFMQIFYEGWQIVKAFFAADAEMPSEVALHRPPQREVARMLFDRRDYPVVDVVEALNAFAQPELLATESREATLELGRGEDVEVETRAVIAPEASAVR
jgi:hypothetical protein